MASNTRSGKQQASAEPEDGNQQLAIRAFSPEQDAELDARFNTINSNTVANRNTIAELSAKYDNMNAKIDQLIHMAQQQ